VLGEAGVEGGVAVGFGGAVFEDAGVGGEEEVRVVEEGFGALGEEGRGGGCVGKGWRWRWRGRHDGDICQDYAAGRSCRELLW